ncbi:tryptophan RNA-binding attenuation protein [Paenibacillus sp. FSL H7-0942]|uniref:tryptophan RNA-binding attenuation protein n=1 Tax=Paenibacillus TaxID=44249 RepID=UPI00096ECB98|nr:MULTISPECIES: tryptophan RNA-binding attenuation protein [Paenibacillus]OMF42200.1 tryptophan RNA-binding attenuation protein [Paenibacillus amylolyticus]PKQ90914.1 tryptophan RNA-binding attenuation protein [Paenibacillus sp. BGI2013]
MSVVISTDDLELSCPHCNGEKQVNEEDQMVPCPKCEGKGVILTTLGQTLLHFIKKHT